MKRKQKILQKRGYLVDESYRGSLTDGTQAVVMDNTVSRDHSNKTKVSYIITQNTNLWAGQNTVAVFKIKKRQADDLSA
jgi:hypothetical protein